MGVCAVSGGDARVCPCWEAVKWVLTILDVVVVGLRALVAHCEGVRARCHCQQGIDMLPKVSCLKNVEIWA